MPSGDGERESFERRRLAAAAAQDGEIVLVQRVGEPAGTRREDDDMAAGVAMLVAQQDRAIEDLKASDLSGAKSPFAPQSPLSEIDPAG